MFGAWTNIRVEERRDTLIASASLFSFMAAHALLETARDALFLASIEAARLPYVYLAVAAVALTITRLPGAGGGDGRRLSLWLVVAGALTLGFWPVVATGATWALYALYVWSAVVVTVVLTQFFVLLGDRFTATQAKRLYAVIGAGSVIGAIAGSGIASIVSSALPARHLLVVAASVLALSAIGPFLLSRSTTKSGVAAGVAEPEERSEASVAEVLGDAYAARLALLVLTATVVFTLIDYIFKSAVVVEVPPEELGLFFARVYLVLNVLSLLAQLFLIRAAVRVLGTTGALAVLPVLLVMGALGVAFGGGIIAVVALKGADGTLRHSLHRTVTELLYVPLSTRLRSAAKSLIDIAGQRGGQAAASLAILAAVGLGVELRWLAVALAVLAAIWVVLAIELRRHYVGLFRATLAHAAERTDRLFPELDVSSLEALMAALNSRNDDMVRAALELLAEQGRQRTIPALILYHPSPAVVQEALEILTESGRTDFLPIADRLLDHEYADVRAAALRARIAGDPDEALIRGKIEVSCPVVKSTALIGLTGAGFAAPTETAEYINDMIDNGSNIARDAVARAIGYRPSPLFEDYLIRLAEVDDHQVRLSAVRSMATIPSARYLPVLVPMLTDQRLRQHVRETLVTLGETALVYLQGSLADSETPLALRRHLPRTIVRFAPSRAGRILVDHLPEEEDGVVRYKILRALGRLVRMDPDLRLDADILGRTLDATLARTYQQLDWRLILERGAEEEPRRRTEAGALLVRMLRDKEANAVERTFRLLGLLFRREDVATIYRGLGSERRDVGSSSRELLDSFLVPPLREAVLGLLDDAPDAQRLRAGAAFHRAEKIGYEELLLQMLDTNSDSLRSLAVYHLGELGHPDLELRLENLPTRPSGFLKTVIQQTLAGLQEPEAGGV